MKFFGNRYLMFFIPYLLFVGSYSLLHNVWNFASFLLTVAYVLVGIILYSSFESKNRYFARGVLWGIISIVIFLFTFGGCGVFQ
jgi:hypothetical protein